MGSAATAASMKPGAVNPEDGAGLVGAHRHIPLASDRPRAGPGHGRAYRFQALQYSRPLMAVIGRPPETMRPYTALCFGPQPLGVAGGHRIDHDIAAAESHERTLDRNAAALGWPAVARASEPRPWSMRPRGRYHS